MRPSAPSLLVLVLLIALGQTPANAPPPVASDTARARIWYLHNSGWAVETPGHLLVFDFIDAAGYDTVSSLMIRLLKAAEREHRRVVVFVSHEHADHYSPAIHRWRKQTPGIKYVFGWKVGPSNDRVLLGARADTLVDSMRIRTVESTDLGVGFLVRVEGLAIFHAGDHAEWNEDERAAYRREIDWLAGFQESVDIAFLPIATGYACDAREDIKVGAAYALTKLRPQVAFPMHVRCTDQLQLYRAFAESMRSFAGRGTLLYAERLGEGFLYEPGQRRVTRLDEREE